MTITAPSVPVSVPELITEPTVIYDLPDAAYHGHAGSLSASGAKMLAPPHPCPAKYRYRLDNPEIKDVFDFGQVAHREVLGKGADVEVLPYDSRQTKAYKEAEAQAREAGKVPILAKDYAKAQAIAQAVREDPLAGPVFTDGQAEVSLFWPDEETGVIRRARFDWLKDKVEGKRRIIGDLKTARSSEPEAFGKSAADYGYAISAANYIDGAIACGLDVDPLFVFVAVEKEPPYVVSTFYADEEVIDLGRRLMRSAIRTYAECIATDRWPGYSTQPERLALPTYYIYKHEDVTA